MEELDADIPDAVFPDAGLDDAGALAITVEELAAIQRKRKTLTYSNVPGTDFNTSMWTNRFRYFLPRPSHCWSSNISVHRRDPSSPTSKTACLPRK
jgi:hypothetical protein